MVMIRHQTKAMNEKIIALAHFGEREHPRGPIVIVQKNGSLLVAPRCHVIQGTGEFDSERAVHRAILAIEIDDRLCCIN